MSDLDAVAVSTRPGLVIALKVGISKALSLARLVHICIICIESFVALIKMHLAGLRAES